MVGLYKILTRLIKLQKGKNLNLKCAITGLAQKFGQFFLFPDPNSNFFKIYKEKFESKNIDLNWKQKIYYSHNFLLI
jgi:hypothetical protein